MKKLFLYLLLFTCLIVAIYSGYLLFTNQTDPVIGSIVLAVDILVLFWNWSLVKKYRISVSSIVAIFVLVALLVGTMAVYAGYEPAVEIKDNIVNKWQNIVSNELELGQEIDARIIYFEAKRQPPDISRVQFLITLEETERTMSGANYTISLLVDEKVIDSKTITADENGKVTSAIELTGHGAGMNRMLGALDQEYKDAKSNYDDFMNEIGWDLFRGELFGKSYDEIKKLQEKEKELKTEVNKWKALSQGNGVNWGTTLHEFCTKYLTISVEREPQK